MSRPKELVVGCLVYLNPGAGARLIGTAPSFCRRNDTLGLGVQRASSLRLVECPVGHGARARLVNNPRLLSFLNCLVAGVLPMPDRG